MRLIERSCIYFVVSALNTQTLDFFSFPISGPEQWSCLIFHLSGGIYHLTVGTWRFPELQRVVKSQLSVFSTFYLALGQSFFVTTTCQFYIPTWLRPLLLPVQAAKVFYYFCFHCFVCACLNFQCTGLCVEARSQYCLSQLFSTLSFQTGSLTKPNVYQLPRLVGPSTLEIFLSLPLRARVTDASDSTCLCFICVLRIQSPLLMHEQKTLH